MLSFNDFVDYYGVLPENKLKMIWLRGKYEEYKKSFQLSLF
jgi:hypothetical protein